MSDIKEMKKYWGIKSIHAEPAQKEGIHGYKVVYENGYESWSPKDVFEKYYFEESTPEGAMIEDSFNQL